jgi:radical SAM-linked protein
MIGLPTESDEDLAAIVHLVDKLDRIRRTRRRRAQINVSVATFIPKAHTPFQWCGQISLDESNRKIKWLKDRFDRPGIQFKWQHPEVSRIEGLWARGDRRLTPLLMKAYNSGCIFDGWSDHFNYQRWIEACRQEGVDIGHYAERERSASEPLPWDVVDTGISRSFLWQEWQNARLGVRTTDCRLGECNACGVCDFKTLAPVVFQSCPPMESSPTRLAESRDSDRRPQRLCVEFSKTGDARHFGHLEMVKLFVRAFRKAGIGLQYSEGYHPKPKLVFQDALPVGFESLKEILYLTTDGAALPEELAETINPHLPPGIRVNGCRNAPGKSTAGLMLTAYRVRLENAVLDPTIFQRFMDRDRFVVTKVNRKGRTQTIDLRLAVDQLFLNSDGTLAMVLKTPPQTALRPMDVLKHLLQLSERQITDARVIKTDSRPYRPPVPPTTQ